VLDPAGAGAETDWAVGVPYYWFDTTLGRWAIQEPARDPAQVVNYSRGNDASYADSLTAQAVDATVGDYGVSMTVAAGNSGPAPRTVNDPAIAYNVIGVGAFSGGGTSDPSDDSVFAWSSRGPTVNGRKKPDLVAVGDGGLAYSYYQSTGQLWKYDTGTSYAAPQVAGGAILLAGAGIRDPKVVKAILINSARPGRATPADAMGTQTGWQPDWGWGELNLDAAYQERLNFARGHMKSNGVRFFKATTQQPGDRATLVWNRRVADCKPLKQGCYYDTASGFRVYALSNLDLTEYDAATEVQHAASASTVDNVEQVRAPAAGNVVYKVAAGGVDGADPEPFAITGTRPLTPLTTPQPHVELTVSRRGPVRSGERVRVDATIANPSPDLTANNARVTLTLPAGVELVDGAQSQTLGTLSTKDAPSDRAVASWTVRGTRDGVQQLIATATANRFGSTFSESAVGELIVDAQPPQVTVATPAGAASAKQIPVEWSAADDSGVASFDVDVAVDDQSFTPWLTSTTERRASYPAIAGSTYRFRVRATDLLGNVSPYAVSAAIAVATPGNTGTGPTTSPPPTGGPIPLSPELKLTSVRSRRGGSLVVRGTVALGANGKVTASWVARGHKPRRASTYAQLRHFTLTMRVPARRRGTLAVKYVGGEGFASQTRRLAVVAR
jgi:hypothetical protein